MNIIKKNLIGLKNHIRLFFMPGFDLFTRRRVRLFRHWLSGTRKVLDVGFGNGWFSYLAYRTGAIVIGVNIIQAQIDKAIQFYNVWLGIPTEQLKFINLNLYDLDCLEPGFDEIICYETLEHIRDDLKICKAFLRLLKPGGYLHLCCPYAEHYKWRNKTLDIEEKGNHVRKGYTLESYRTLLESIGFEIVDAEGMGGVVLTRVWLFLETVRNRFGNALFFPLSSLAIPLVWLDPILMNCPYALYVKAIKRV